VELIEDWRCADQPFQAVDTKVDERQMGGGSVLVVGSSESAAGRTSEEGRDRRRPAAGGSGWLGGVLQAEPRSVKGLDGYRFGWSFDFCSPAHV